jgi:hypothetical protein
MMAIVVIGSIEFRRKILQRVAMEFSVRYESRRNEVWRWYWRAWRRGLWKTHAVVFSIIALATSLAVYGHVPTDVRGCALVCAVGFVPLIGFVIWPVIMFKPQTRTLAVDERGIATTIGILNKTLPWHEIGDVQEHKGSVVITGRNQNAFIVPARAFGSTQAMLEFQNYAGKMTASAKNKNSNGDATN